jgi:hypothetical protein
MRRRPRAGTIMARMKRISAKSQYKSGPPQIGLLRNVLLEVWRRIVHRRKWEDRRELKILWTVINELRLRVDTEAADAVWFLFGNFCDALARRTQ